MTVQLIRAGQVVAVIPREVWDDEPLREIGIMNAAASAPDAARRMGGRLAGDYVVQPPMHDEDDGHLFWAMVRDE